MKKVVVFVFLAMVLIGSCAAQSANDTQRIVGTWTEEEGTVWVFNANGTGTRGGNNFNYGISVSGGIYIDIPSYRGYTLYISPDGRRMIFSTGGQNRILFVKN